MTTTGEALPTDETEATVAEGYVRESDMAIQSIERSVPQSSQADSSKKTHIANSDINVITAAVDAKQARELGAANRERARQLIPTITRRPILEPGSSMRRPRRWRKTPNS